MPPHPVSDEEIIKRAAYQMRVHKEIEPVSGCWLFTGSLWSNDYGKLAGITRELPGKVHRRVHITAWLVYKGLVPKGKLICHKCSVKRCFNPKHLYAGTNRQNQLDAVKAGTFAAMWTLERRAEWSRRFSGKNNPMFGRRGKRAPAFGRVGTKHPMFGRQQKLESRQKISESLIKFYETQNQ